MEQGKAGGGEAQSWSAVAAVTAAASTPNTRQVMSVSLGFFPFLGNAGLTCWTSMLPGEEAQLVQRLPLQAAHLILVTSMPSSYPQGVEFMCSAVGLGHLHFTSAPREGRLGGVVS